MGKVDFDKLQQAIKRKRSDSGLEARKKKPGEALTSSKGAPMIDNDGSSRSMGLSMFATSMIEPSKSSKPT